MKKNVILVLGIYATGVFVTLLANKKTPVEIEKELVISNNSGEGKCRVLMNNFIEVHKNLFDNLKEKFLNKEQQKVLNDKKDEIVLKFNDFKEKAEKLLEEYHILGKNSSGNEILEKGEETLEKLETFYNSKLKELDELKEKTPEKIENMKSKIVTYFEEVKAKIKK